jgi:dTDP-glucose pyrophosphorylase
MFFPPFDIESIDDRADGMLSLYQSDKPSCSFASIVGHSVVEVAEKKVISPYATTGLYYFKRSNTFFTLGREMMRYKETVNGEYYIAPVYNKMIDCAMSVGYEMVSKVNVLGTPEELKCFEDGQGR